MLILKLNKMDEEEMLKKIMKDFNTCDVCGGKSFEHGIYKGKTFDLCTKCTIKDWKEKEGLP